MKKMKSLFTLVFIAILFSASGQKNDDNLEWAENRKLEKQLNIQKLESSDYDKDLRIFLGRGITNGGSVLWIRKKGGLWAATRFDYFLKMNKKEEVTSKIKNFNKTNLTPNSEWEVLWSHLKELGITDLPTQAAIREKLRKEVTTMRGKGYQVLHVLDGSGYDVAIKENERVRTYSFHEPWTYAEKFPDVSEVRQYSEIIQTLEKELSINFR